MVNEFKLPDVGEGLTEAELVTWHVEVGDQIKVNDVVCDIETAKSVVELPSPYAGFVQALLVQEGETVDVGGGGNTVRWLLGRPLHRRKTPLYVRWRLLLDEFRTRLAPTDACYLPGDFPEADFQAWWSAQRSAR